MSEKGLLKIVKKLGFTDEQKQELKKRLAAISGNSVLRVQKNISFKWAPIARDYNKIHLFDSAAKEAGFEKTLVHGTYLAAHKEQYVLDILRIINAVNGVNEDEKKKEIFYVNESIEFKRPLYHGKKTSWNCDDVIENDDGVSFKFSAVNEKNKEIVPNSISKLGLERKIFTAEDMHDFSGSLVVDSREDEIKSDELELCYECLKRTPQGIVPMMLPAVFTPSLLLDICSRETGKPEGVYSSMNLEFYNQPNLEGKFVTRIIMSTEPVKQRRFYKYTFKTLCTQEKTPILSGEVVCQSPKKVKLD